MNIRPPIVAAILTLATLSAGRASDGPEHCFTDVPASGLNFTHFNGMSGELYYPEIMAPGVALFDFDHDGDLDVFVVQGRMLGSKPIDSAWFPPRGGSSIGSQLFRNDLEVGADSVAAPRSATSTTTVTPTSSSATRAVRCGCCSTGSDSAGTGSA
jgi:enediyne biosynthesis protein E4